MNLLNLIEQVKAHFQKIGQVSELTAEIEQVRQVASILQNTLTSMHKIISSGSKEENELFKQRIGDFLHNKEQSVLQITDRICQAESELTATKDRLTQSVSEMETLTKQNGVLIKELASLMSELQQQNSCYGAQTDVSEALSTHGIFASAAAASPSPMKTPLLSDLSRDQFIGDSSPPGQ